MEHLSLLANFSLLTIIALLFWWIFEKIKLPGLLGMILTGIILGPKVLNLISPEIMDVSKELKTAALIVILIRAGLGINKDVLNKVGVSAIKMSIIPGIIEGSTITLIAHFFLRINILEAGMLGFIIAAVSPAVVVPQMLDLKEKGYGKSKEVPTLVLAGASVDDVFAITIFSTFLALFLGGKKSIFLMLINPFIAIALGLICGLILGYLLVIFLRNII